MVKVFREFSRHAQKDRWPLAFDLEGVPRDNKVRSKILEGETMAKNNFGDSVIDLSKPPKEAYTHQEYPKILYKYDAKPRSVKSEEEEAAALADGYTSDAKLAAQPPEAPVAAVTLEESEPAGDSGEVTEFRPRKRK